MKSLLPFGTPWPMDAGLRERASQEREVFRSWVARLEIPESQGQVLTELVLTVEAAGPLWLTDSWVPDRNRGLS